MAIFAISDLHLALGIDKPMDVFGGNWHCYMDKIKEHWESKVTDGDYVVIPGDISWATYLEQAVEDFRFIEALPGKKIISKGNHDYWWMTQSKLQKFLQVQGLQTIKFMHNNSFRIGDVVICGTRGWDCPGSDGFTGEDRKIYERELQRLELSLKSFSSGDNVKIVAALHYPPFNMRKEPSGFVEILKRYGVSLCIYGHLHAEGCRNAVEGTVDGVEYKLISADYLNFKPLLLSII